MAQHAGNLDAVRRLARAQEDRHRLASAGLVDMDRQEAAAVVMGVEQRELLSSMHLVLGIIDVEHDTCRHLGETVAEQIDHRCHHAHEHDGAGQVLQPAHGGLRTQRRAALRQPANRQLEGRIITQRVAVIAIGIAGSDQKRAEADHLGKPMLNRSRIAWVLDATCQPLSDAKTALDLRQQQNAAVRGQPATIKRQLNRLAANRWKARQNPVTIGHGGCELRETVLMLLRHQNHTRIQRDMRIRQLDLHSATNYPG